MSEPLIVPPVPEGPADRVDDHSLGVRLHRRASGFDDAVDRAFDQIRGQKTIDRLFYEASELGDFSLIWYIVGGTQALRAPDPEAALREGWLGKRPRADDAAAASEVLRIYGQPLLLGTDRTTIDRGRRLIAASFAIAGQAGRSVVSQQAWFAYFEALVYLRRPAEVIPRAAAATRQLQELGHGDATVRFAELTTVSLMSPLPLLRPAPGRGGCVPAARPRPG